MISRRHTRQYLLSQLFTRSYAEGNTEIQSDDIYFDADFLKKIDKKYLQSMTESIIENEATLLSIIHALAPKFDLETMPRIHVCILFISLAEILYWTADDINNKISVNEALELAKDFSDDHGKNFIHGVLSTFLKNPEKYTKIQPGAYHFFS